MLHPQLLAHQQPGPDLRHTLLISSYYKYIPLSNQVTIGLHSRQFIYTSIMRNLASCAGSAYGDHSLWMIRRWEIFRNATLLSPLLFLLQVRFTTSLRSTEIIKKHEEGPSGAFSVDDAVTKKAVVDHRSRVTSLPPSTSNMTHCRVLCGQTRNNK